MKKVDKELIRGAMKSYLERQGYPNITSEEIIKKHLIPMFQLLVRKGLVPKEVFPYYREAAIQQYMIARVRGAG